MTTMTEQSIRNGSLLNSGTLSPNPWDLTHSGQNDRLYNRGIRTGDRAPQGCDPSAASSAGMATGGFDAEAAQNTQTPTRPRLTYSGPNLVLTKGSTLRVESRAEATEWLHEVLRRMTCSPDRIVPSIFQFGSLNLISTCAFIGIGSPFRVAGLKRHCLRHSMAFSSNPKPSPFTI